MVANPSWNTRWQKLAPTGDRYGVGCDEDGPCIGPVRLFEKTAKGLAPRSAEELDFIFGQVFGCRTNFATKMTGLRAVARALEAGDVAKAMIATQLTHLPTLPDEAAFRRAVRADTLAKAGFNPAEPCDDGGRWTADGNDSQASAFGDFLNSDRDQSQAIPVAARSGPRSEDECHQLYERDVQVCRSLPGPSNRARCYAVAADRLGIVWEEENRDRSLGESRIRR
jgi:hypothetical protein